MFLNRTQELAFLHSVLTRTHPGPGQFLMIYGRSRVGKTALWRISTERGGTATRCESLQVVGSRCASVLHDEIH